jgi:hypothetical protein
MADSMTNPRSPKLVKAPTGGAAAAVAMLERGGSVFALTKGQYSLIDVILAMLDRTGPADVWISTWSVSIRDAETAAELLRSSKIRALKLYTDKSLASVKPLYAAALVRLFGRGACRTSSIHAKIAVIQNDAWSVVIRSSMNLNRNPRFEQWDADDNPELAEFVLSWFREMDAAAPVGPDGDLSEAGRSFQRARLTDAEIRAAVAEVTEDPGAKVAPSWAGKAPWGAR